MRRARRLGSVALAAGLLVTGLIVAAPRAGAAGQGVMLDRTVTTDQDRPRVELRSAPLQTSAPGELVVALLASDGPLHAQHFSTVSGGSLLWRLVSRADGQAGAAEIWQAWAAQPLGRLVVTARRADGAWVGSITVAAYRGAQRTTEGTARSAPAGAPSLMMRTRSADALILAAGDDWDRATARVPERGQRIVHEHFSPTDDTYWVQSLPRIARVGTEARIADRAPSGDRYNLAAIEIDPAAGSTRGAPETHPGPGTTAVPGSTTTTTGAGGVTSSSTTTTAPGGSGSITTTSGAGGSTSTTTTTTTGSPGSTTTTTVTTTTVTTTVPTTTTTTNTTTTVPSTTSTQPPPTSVPPTTTPPVTSPPPPGSVPDAPSPVVLPAGWPAARSVWPGPSNTGVPAGVVLHPPVNGDPNYTLAGNSVIVTKDGAVINGLDISGQLFISANGVVVENTRVRDGADGNPILVDYNRTINPPAVIEDTEVDGLKSYNCEVGIGDSNMLLLRVNIHDCADGVRDNGTVVVQDSWIHDLNGAPDAHNDGIQATEGSNVFIYHNYVSNPLGETSCVQVGADQGPIANVVEEDNLLNGGGYSIYGGAAGPYPVTNIKILNNRIMHLPQAGAYFATGGAWGPVTATGDPAITYQGNIWDDTGQPAN